MKEILAIIQAYERLLKSGKKSALATVVHVDGSSYRRPGARMLVADDGQLIGAISGGCLEGDALRKALLVINQQQSKLVTYDTSDEEDATIGIQLGCAGIIQVLFEPVDAHNPYNPIQLLRKAIAVRQPAVLATLFNMQNRRQAQPGTCLLMEGNGNLSGQLPNQALEPLIKDDMLQALATKHSGFKQYIANQFSITAFVEVIKPAVNLVIVGAGNDAIPLMQMAEILGWQVRVADGRNTHARPDRFESACQILVSKPEALLQHIPIDDQTVFVLMTHNYNYDKAMLQALLPLSVPYIGILGPKRKLQLMLEDIKTNGLEITEAMLQKVYGPTGLELGAETAEEIALSILAEIKAVLEKKPGGSLKHKADVIHSRSEAVISPSFLSV
ncbi:MAG TPA: XdhC family protein [Phnomibacter sp.]|nr:XdhC family protein [Phnomibacter sp.]